jgi:hypothetical protein
MVYVPQAQQQQLHEPPASLIPPAAYYDMNQNSHLINEYYNNPNSNNSNKNNNNNNNNNNRNYSNSTSSKVRTNTSSKFKNIKSSDCDSKYLNIFEN